MKLVAFLGNDKENYGQVTALINRMECEKIILVKDKETSAPFNKKNISLVDIDTKKDLLTFKTQLKEKLSKELGNDLEVALSIASGTGKDHMALISALLSIPVGIKLAAFTKKGVEFIS